MECNVLIDAVGGAQMERRLVEQMRDAGVTFCWFRPPKPYAVRRLQHRTHRKLLIVDGANVVKTDVMATNGVIHVIDSVLMPKM